mmetsp:Transcript_7270/g.21384  ORF Transcript_7270/g.21384 Transcript_7270/m.21384 type:complete len:140 (-) Transcript_7270:237-656(-)
MRRPRPYPLASRACASGALSQGARAMPGVRAFDVVAGRKQWPCLKTRSAVVVLRSARACLDRQQQASPRVAPASRGGALAATSPSLVRLVRPRRRAGGRSTPASRRGVRFRESARGTRNSKRSRRELALRVADSGVTPH